MRNKSQSGGRMSLYCKRKDTKSFEGNSFQLCVCVCGSNLTLALHYMLSITILVLLTNVDTLDEEILE